MDEINVLLHLYNGSKIILMKGLILIAFLTISHSCFSQISSYNYSLTLRLAPSFMSSCILKIQKSKNQNSIRLMVKDSLKSYGINEIFLVEKELLPLTTFLKTYKFKIKNNVDTVESHKISSGKGDSTTIYTVESGTDGIDVSGELSQNGIAHHFAFWSPNKGTENAKFMNIIFDLLEKSFLKDADIDYIESLREYFPHKMIVRKISVKPLKYKLYANINQDQQDDLNKFLKALPKHQPVYIDVSIVAIAPIIEDDLAHNKNIYWINPSKFILRELQELEISKRHILFTKNIKLNKIRLKK